MSSHKSGYMIINISRVLQVCKLLVTAIQIHVMELHWYPTMHVDTYSISYTMRYQRMFAINDWNVIEVKLPIYRMVQKKAQLLISH